MTDQEQNIAVAEACGWKRMDVLGGSVEWWGRWEKGNNNPLEIRTSCPDYGNDLNAMHEAEKWLFTQPFGKEIYVSKLVTICSGIPFGQAFAPTRKHWEDTVHATAAQRREAFLRTIGKWKE